MQGIDASQGPTRGPSDAEEARHLPAGGVGTAAVYAEHVEVAHVIRKIARCQMAILNYVNPF